MKRVQILIATHSGQFVDHKRVTFEANSRLNLERHPQRTDLAPGYWIGRVGQRSVDAARQSSPFSEAIGDRIERHRFEIVSDSDSGRNRSLAQAVALAFVI